MAQEGREEMLDRLEEEVRRDLGIQRVGPGMTTEEAGKIGGYMVKRLIERGERAEGGGMATEGM